MFYPLTFMKTSFNAFIMSCPVSQGHTIAATLSRPSATCLSRGKFRRGNTMSVSRSRNVGQKSGSPSPTNATTSYLMLDFRQCSSRMSPLHMLAGLKLHQSCRWYGDRCRQPALSNDAGFVYTLLNINRRPLVSSMCSIIACPSRMTINTKNNIKKHDKNEKYSICQHNSRTIVMLQLRVIMFRTLHIKFYLVRFPGQ